MRYICHDCGYEIPSDMDFCPRCGCLRTNATTVGDDGMPADACPSCGAHIDRGAVYCPSCGNKVPEAVTVMPRANKMGMAAIALALIPGIFNIFGLGHLVLKQWSRGAMFIALTVIILYMNGWQLFSSNIMIYLITLAVYMYQAMDIFRYVYIQGGR